MKYSFIWMVLFFVSGCSDGVKQAEKNNLVNELGTQLKVLAADIPENEVPRSYPVDGKIRFVGSNDWTSGFPAGSFWMMYEFTKEDYWQIEATKNTVKLDGIQYLTNTHDLGFMAFCSYGNGYRLTGNEAYKDVIIQASESLISRFDSTAGCIRSWDFGSWQFPVIIDNMMNLEMLFWASKETNDPRFREVAVSHADKTMENHFREDWSSVHVVDYDTITGEVIRKETHQGYSDESAWARGQAWGLYGFTMTYRETDDPKYLKVAENIADYTLANLPDDMVPYWDYNAPDIPDAKRDVSAATITASALYELQGYSDKGDVYLEAANEIMESLTSEKYRAVDGSNAGFLLKHSVGNMPGGDEVDVAINYADYYYLEALIRKQNVKN